ncbi:MAG: hypothetical protein WDN69_02885 [Aliidongia sp.]
MLSEQLAPQTRAYHEIWVGDTQVAPIAEPEVDPLYGPTYLPRKFKIGIATPDDNGIDVLTNDLAVIPHFAGDTLEGYTLAIGGGLGMTHNKPHTYPRLATPIAFIGPDDLLAGAKAVIKLHRDHGDRSDRKHARLKYAVDAMGLDAAKAELERHFGGPLAAPRPLPVFQVQDHIGWHEQGRRALVSRRHDRKRPDRGPRRLSPGDGFAQADARRADAAGLLAQPGRFPGRYRRERQGAGRGDPDRRIGAAAGQRHAAAPLGARLSGAADLRPGAERSGARLRPHRFRYRGGARAAQSDP